ncbi:dihydroneopterin aldolase [Longibacter salinarum]|uniref:7,8-dihydroneopterin aldolase n=1 Tax=Longibacter salinarum TaxID=1850348 RepID=A0A2A8D2K3_9BACT|nr:dihydroneopterin aldolase [Longibacter salinarum]PEN15169.1 dihydroneopterin aldolase [Longibacter salinarum]
MSALSSPDSSGRALSNSSGRTGSTIGTVRLINAVFYGHHGVMQEEHRIGGRYEVDVSVDLDFESAAVHDDLDETVNYEKVYTFVRELVTENNFYLIEKLAYRIANKVAEFYPNIESVEVTVRKPNPPVGGPCDRAEAVYRMTPSQGE